MIDCICKNCGKNFQKSKTEINRTTNNFCSNSCAATYNNKQRKPDRLCLNCGKCINGTNSNRITCSYYCNWRYKTDQKLQNKTASANTIKKHLKDTVNFCSICNLPPVWNNQPIVFTLDHIDGNPSNNGLNNLRLICPNCDSQLPTFKGRNKGNGRHHRRQRYKDGKSY